LWFITGRIFFRQAAGESCYSVYSDVPWLTVTPVEGAVPPGGSLPFRVTLDAGALSPGSYSATLLVLSNDAGSYLMHIPVTLTVKALKVYYLPVVVRDYQPQR
jgi:hypothetical protein